MKVILTDKESKSLEEKLTLAKEFVPIPDLAQGDVLRYRGGSNYRYPAGGELIVVYSTDVPTFDEDKVKRRILRDDFTALIKDEDGDILEFSYDSRYFDKVEVED